MAEFYLSKTTTEFNTDEHGSETSNHCKRIKNSRTGRFLSDFTLMRRPLCLRVFYEVYNELGGGFVEIVYQKAFAMALRQAGLTVAVEEPIPVFFRGVVIGDFRADLTVNGCSMLELKAVAALDRAHESQILNYLRATDFEIGLFAPNFRAKTSVQAISNGQTTKTNPSSSV